MNIPQQSSFLYEGKWSPEIDIILVDTIISLKRETRWTLHEFPSWFLLTAVQEIEINIGVLFSEVDLCDRLEVLRVRYRTFKEVLGHCGAYWDMPSKCVIANNALWGKIFKKNSFAGAYYYHDEPLYSKLACLFGMDDVKVEGEKQVIVISDNTEKLPTDDPSCYKVSEGDPSTRSPHASSCGSNTPIGWWSHVSK
ncbi:hypothetical protein AAHA92_22272 [Salvia divinorum]|uniref:Myb/SANT-like domain-containing protein n=1 Tax=Salvia divinorum TaxID=28513 RepID=A0ABD1GN55_SALDI